ncbi:MAG: OFA family MFS transporter [Candidatus Altiarchaeota archaeon]|nr:OFA family MFS transporter [Candidatus Altiarchaeota archaeon]
MGSSKSNRWLIVVGGILINLMLGVTYTWSIFGAALQKDFKWAVTDERLAFSIMLLFFAVTMPLAGRIQDKKGPRLIALIGGLLLGLGFIASSLSVQDNILMYITYGVLAGSGVGFAYNAPIAAGSKWFPDKRGLVMGLMVFGFGFGSVLLAPMAEILISGVPAQPTGLIQPIVASIFNLPGLNGLAGIGLQSTFLTLGVLFIIVVCIGAMLLKNPPEGWKPEGWDPTKVKKAVTHAYKEFSISEIIKMRQFWLLWVMFTFSASAGLMVIGFLKNFASLTFETVHDFPAAAAGLEGALAVSVLAIFNGVGRIFAGWLSDQIGRTKTMFVLFAVQAVLVSTLVYTATLSTLAVYAVMALIGVCFGANFALFPSATADFFGTKNVGVNYGAVFTAYGVGGILGPMLSANMVPATASVGGYTMPGIIIGLLVGIAALMALFVKPPEPEKKG